MSRIHHNALHILFGLLLWVPVPLLGQEGHAFIHHFDRKEVAGELTSWNIVAVRNDRVAAANGDGLLIHNGGQWKLHELPNLAAARSLAVMPDGRWLIGGQGYVGLASIDSFETCLFEDLTPNIVKAAGGFEDVWRIFPLSGPASNQNPQFFLATSNFTGILDASGAFQLLRKGNITNGFLWGKNDVGWQVGDSIWQWASGRPRGMAIPPDLRVEAVHMGPNGNLKMFTHNDGIMSASDARNPEWTLSESPLSLYLRENRTNCILQSKPQQWWIGTSRGGLVESLDLENITLIHDKSSGLANNAVTSISMDDQRNLWAATEGGIDLLRLSWPVKKAEPNIIADQPGFASYHDWANELIYWGTSQGVYLESMTSGEVNRLTEIPGPTWAIQEVGNRLWISHINGCGYLDDNLKYQAVISDVGVWGIWPAPDGNLYAGTFQGVQPIENNPFGKPQTRPRLTGFSESSRFMHFDHPDTLWVSHPYKGAYRLAIDLASNTIQIVNAFASDKGFPEPMDVYLRDVDGELLFATSKGIYEWNRQTDRMQLASGNWVKWLDPDAGFNLIEADDWGNLWAFSGSVLIRFSAKREQLNAAVEVKRAPFTDAPPIDGFERMEFLPDGRVCAPTETGFVYIDPVTMLEEGDVPVVQIDQVTHLNHPNGPKALPIHDLNLPAGSHALQIDLTSVDSRWTGRLKYQWRISEVSEEWSSPQFGQTIAVSGLQPGTHNVEFRALINPALTGPSKSLAIVIQKPWYQWWIVRAAFFLFTLVIFGFWLERNKTRLERSHKLATEKQQAEIQEVENKLAEERLQFAQSQVQAKDAELASMTMNLVQKSQLVQTVQTNLRKIKHELNPLQQKEVDQLLKLIQESGKLDDAWEQFTQQFDQVHIDFHQRLIERFPDLTKNDVKLCSYLRMGLSTKEIASLMFVTVRAVEVSRSRLRKRLQLPKDVKLTIFIQNL